MNNAEKLKAFKNDLRELLEKYQADINCNIEGDTDGVSGTMMVDFKKPGTAWKWDSYKLSNGFDVSSADLQNT